jgi:hypothetical protein
VGRLAMIMSMPVGKLFCRSAGVMLVMSSGREVFPWAVAEGGGWPGYFSCICVIRCWRDVYAYGSVSAQAYVLMWCPTLRRASRPVAVPP